MTNKYVSHLPKTKPRFFYGWWIVGACFLITLITTGVIMTGFTAFFEPIVNEFGWSYTQVSLAASLRGLEMGLLAPVAGFIVDRYGPRKIVFTGALFLGIGLVLLSRVSTLAMLYAAFVLITIGTSACIGVVIMTAVANWFQRKASIVIGITMSGSAVGGLMVPVITVLIEALGWRTTVLTLGLGMCGFNMALSLLLRHKPEQYGYLPDGEEMSLQNIDQAADKEQEIYTEPEIGFKQILVNRTFWHIALSYFAVFTVVTSVTTHIMPYLSSIGIARAKSSLLASTLTVVTLFGRLGFGWLGDRFNKKMLAVITLTAICLGLVLLGLISIGGIWLTMPFIILFSIGWGGIAVMLTILLKTYFGGSSFGTILGSATFIGALGQVLGPTMAGWIFDIWGSYQGAWFGLTVFVFFITIIMATTPKVSISGSTADIQKV